MGCSASSDEFNIRRSFLCQLFAWIDVKAKYGKNVNYMTVFARHRRIVPGGMFPPSLPSYFPGKSGIKGVTRLIRDTILEANPTLFRTRHDPYVHFDCISKDDP